MTTLDNLQPLCGPCNLAKPLRANPRKRLLDKLWGEAFNAWNLTIFPTAFGSVHGECHQPEAFFLDQPNVLSRLVVALALLALRIHPPVFGENPCRSAFRVSIPSTENYKSLGIVDERPAPVPILARCSL